MVAGAGLSPDSFVNPSLPLYLMLGPVWLQDRAARSGLLPGHAADPLLLGRCLSALAGAAAVLCSALPRGEPTPASARSPRSSSPSCRAS